MATSDERQRDQVAPDAREAVTDAMIERALKAQVPGGSQVWVWLPQKDAWTPHQTARDVMRCALEAALATPTEVARPGVLEAVARIDEEIFKLYIEGNEVPEQWRHMGRVQRAQVLHLAIRAFVTLADSTASKEADRG